MRPLALEFASLRSLLTRTAYRQLTMTAENQAAESLTEALAKARIPSANHEFIRQITSAIGIAEYRTVGSSSATYIKGKRRDGLPDLHIYYGYTNGFSEEELVRIAGSAARAPSSRTGTWYVEHPVNQVRPGTARSRITRREAGFCDCGMQLSLTGACANCD
jgi:hypothetical protein